MCQDVELKGDITIGAGKSTPVRAVNYAHLLATLGTIVHPKATIFAIQGPIVIGANNIIEEGAILVNRYELHTLVAGFLSWS